MTLTLISASLLLFEEQYQAKTAIMIENLVHLLPYKSLCVCCYSVLFLSEQIFVSYKTSKLCEAVMVNGFYGEENMVVL